MFEKLLSFLRGPADTPPDPGSAAETTAGSIAAASDSPDQAIAFGYKTGWLAIRSEDPSAVAEALGLTDLTPANWQTGLVRAIETDGLIFVTPPLSGWVLAVTGLDLGADSKENLAAVVSRLRTCSKQFGEAQMFGSYRVVDYVAWIRAVDGGIVRAFVAGDGQYFANIGRTTDAERAVGLGDISNLTLDQLVDLMAEENDTTRHYDEEDPARIAGHWSLDPLKLEDDPDRPTGTGLLGTLPTAG